MSKPDKWMPLYIADYLAATTRLSTEQHGAYLLLLMDYWRNGPPPDEDETLAAITGLPLPRWKQQRPFLLRFFAIEAGTWRQKRADKELGEWAAYVQQKSNAGKASAEAKAQRKANAHSTAVATDGQQNDQPSPSPSSLRSEPPHTPRKRGALSAEQVSEFEGWYAKYPHKVGRGAAERAWNGARAQASLAELSEGLARYIATKRPDVPWCNPATWLNAKRWLDAPADTTPVAEQSEVSQADRDARRAKWGGRLTEFRETGKWQTAWGSEPWSGNTGCLVPLDMRADFDNARLVVEMPANLRRTA